MTRKFLPLLFSFLLLGTSSFAQRDCAAMDVLENQIKANPERAVQLDRIEQFTQEYLQSNPEKNGAIVTIPVVFHVVWNTTAENISTAQIQTQLDVLNEDFRRLNSDADGTWGQAADTEIEFCLATVDPNGNAHSGITRTNTSVSSFSSNDNVKFNSSGGKDAWPAADYLNYWVCDLSGGLLGYAQFPGGPANTDGVVCDYLYTGTIGTATAPFDLGRTGTHEVGHWLNLRHIWGDGNCNFDDFVSDTPESDASNVGCATGHVSCGTVDMVQNYMDYSDDACMNLFTAGQRDRMQALFAQGGARASLLNSPGCGGGGGPGGCTDNEIQLTLNFDNYPEETTWEIRNSGGGLEASGGPYGSQPDGSTLVIDICLTDGCYDFTIFDSYGDGICCGYGQGSYSLDDGGTNLASGGQFASSETTNFCLSGGGGGPDTQPPSTPTNLTASNTTQTTTDISWNASTDNVGVTGYNVYLNGGLLGSVTGTSATITGLTASTTYTVGVSAYDAAGNESGQASTNVTTQGSGGGGSNELFAHYFETGWDGWQDGGSDCYRYSGSRSYEGNYSIRIRDNSGTNSAMTSQTWDVSSYDELEIDFHFYPKQHGKWRGFLGSLLRWFFLEHGSYPMPEEQILITILSTMELLPLVAQIITSQRMRDSDSSVMQVEMQIEFTLMPSWLLVLIMHVLHKQEI